MKTHRLSFLMLLPAALATVLVLWLAAPAGTPDPVIQQLSRTLVKALQERDLQEQLTIQSVSTLSSTPQELAEKIKRDMVVYARLVKDSGARAE